MAKDTERKVVCDTRNITKARHIDEYNEAVTSGFIRKSAEVIIKYEIIKEMSFPGDVKEVDTYLDLDIQEWGFVIKQVGEAVKKLFQD